MRKFSTGNGQLSLETRLRLRGKKEEARDLKFKCDCIFRGRQMMGLTKFLVYFDNFFVSLCISIFVRLNFLEI